MNTPTDENAPMTAVELRARFGKIEKQMDAFENHVAVAWFFGMLLVGAIVLLLTAKLGASTLPVTIPGNDASGSPYDATISEFDLEHVQAQNPACQITLNTGGDLFEYDCVGSSSLPAPLESYWAYSPTTNAMGVNQVHPTCDGSCDVVPPSTSEVPEPRSMWIVSGPLIAFAIYKLAVLAGKCMRFGGGAHEDNRAMVFVRGRAMNIDDYRRLQPPGDLGNQHDAFVHQLEHPSRTQIQRFMAEMEERNARAQGIEPEDERERRTR